MSVDGALSAEELFESLWTLAGDAADSIRYWNSGFAVSEISPKVCQVIQSVSIDMLLNRFRPLLVGDRDVSN